MNPIRFFIPILLSFSFSVLLAQTPPANDDISNAVTLTVYDNLCESDSRTSGTTVGFTNSPDLTGRDFLCEDFRFDSSTVFGDVWYKATVPDSGNISFSVVAPDPLVGV